MSATQSAVAPRGGSLSAWWMAARPKTLTASLAPVAVGTGVALGEGVARWGPALAALLGSLFIQIGTNLFNDYYDFLKGADTEERVGPVRVTQSGLLKPRTVLAMALGAFGLATVAGLYLLWVAGWPIVVVGLVSLAAGYAYTGGPFPLAYHGLGDVFSFVFFGPVAVAGTHYVQAGRLSGVALVAGCAVGLLSVALLSVNNLRDFETDTKANKRTLVVRLGMRAGRVEFFATVLLAFALPVLLWALGWTGAGPLLCLAALPLVVRPARVVVSEKQRGLLPALAMTARLQLVHGFLLAIGLWSPW